MSTNHVIDAKGKKLGRVATEAAKLLMGKNLATFARHKAPDVTVTITNAGKLSIPEKKRETKGYARFSGYPGGLRFDSLNAVIAKKGVGEALRHAVRGMIPNNRLRPDMLKRLKISE